MFENIIKSLLKKSLAAVFMAASLLLAEQEVFFSDSDLRMISHRMLLEMESRHYLKDNDQKTLSNRLYDQFFDELDPAHIYFTELDHRAFFHCRDRLFMNLRIGDTSFGFNLYQLYTTRIEEFQKFAADMLANPVDFTVDEEFDIDRRNSPRPANRDEMLDLWRKKIKNDLLYYRLLDRSLARQKNSAVIEKISPEKRLLNKLRDITNLILKRSTLDITALYLDTAAKVFGPHSGYTSPADRDDFDIHMSLSLIGIGATLTSEGGLVKIVSLVPGGPAAKSGKLKVGDKIIAVAQEDGSSVDIIDMPVDKAVHLIRGKEGSKVSLTVLSGDKGLDSVPVSITIVREKINLTESMAQGKIREIKAGDDTIKKIGVLTLPGFYMDFEAVRRRDPDARSCSRDVWNILNEFNKNKVDAVVFDLRNNGGGSLQEAIRIAGMFFRTGPVVQLRDRDREISIINDPDPSVTYSGPLVVLTSKLSASASEIFAGALKDCQRAVLVGDSRTFGKGTVLEVSDLRPYPSLFSNSAPAGMLTVESSMFFRTCGDSVQQKGIAPDIILPSLTEEMEYGEVFLPYHLPWDAVAPVIRPGCDPALPHKIPLLTKRSAERISRDGEYREMLKKIDLLKARKARKTISLNEEKRMKEYHAEKIAMEELEKTVSGKNEEKKQAKDPVLDESVMIAVDLAMLSNRKFDADLAE